MQVNHSEVAAASRIGTASATCPVLRILSAIVFVSAGALVACRSGKPEETPAITFTEIPPAAQGGRERVDTISGLVRNVDQTSRLLFMRTAGHGGCSPGSLTSARDGDR
jgi:hypothetical protein